MLACDTASLYLSIIVPAFNAERYLPRCLSALAIAVDKIAAEIIVVDDGSTDRTAHIARQHGVRLIQLSRNIGRGAARNMGARDAGGSVLLFVDADVVVHRDTVSKIAEIFRTKQDCHAMFGSYDTEPAAKNSVSQYRNLLHHYVHVRNGTTARHFWTGLGAVRREAFNAVSGFDEGEWSRNMEEVEFGGRLVKSGYRIDVFPEIQGTHLKNYSLLNMIKIDLFDRAIPWTRYMIASGNRENSFVFSWTQRLSVAGAGLVLLSPFLLWYWPLFALFFLGGAGLFVGINFRLWRFFSRERNLAFAVKCIPLYWLYALCCGFGYLYATVFFRIPSEIVSRWQETHWVNSSQKS